MNYDLFSKNRKASFFVGDKQLALAGQEASNNLEANAKDSRKEGNAKLFC